MNVLGAWTHVVDYKGSKQDIDEHFLLCSKGSLLEKYKPLEPTGTEPSGGGLIG